MSTGDSRDRALDRLLRSAGRPALPTAECLDAETVAAYADGGLAGPAQAAAEAHMAGCARCQMVMATIVASSGAGEAAPAHAPGRSWWTDNLRWLVPLAGTAAAVAIWMVVPANGPATERARVEGPRTPLERESKAVAPPPMPASPPASAKEVTPEPTSELAGREPASQLRDRATLDAAAPKNEASGRSEADRLAKVEERSAGAGATPAGPPVAALEARAAETDQRPAAPPPPPAAAAAPAPALDAANRTASRIGPDELRSLDPAVRWRLADLGFVERSTNGGTSWDRVDTGVRIPLKAGACPTASTCWVVGDAGVVLRTTDALTWRPVTSPTPEPLVAVEATSEAAAVVRATDGQRFRTSDGGATWTRLP